MHVIICLDDRNGLSFNGRRLSSDRTVYRRIADTVEGSLWMNSRSAKLFAGYSVCVDEDFLKNAEQKDSCFVESLEFILQLSHVDSLTIYRWNRHYPSDTKLPEDFLTNWRCVSKSDFTGNSHNVITEERYVP